MKLTPKQLRTFKQALTEEHLPTGQHTLLWFIPMPESDHDRYVLGGIYTFRPDLTCTNPKWLLLARWSLIARDEGRYEATNEYAQKEGLERDQQHLWNARQTISALFKRPKYQHLLVDPEGNVEIIKPYPTLDVLEDTYTMIVPSDPSTTIQTTTPTDLNAVPQLERFPYHRAVLQATIPLLLEDDQIKARSRQSLHQFMQERVASGETLLPRLPDSKGHQWYVGIDRCADRPYIVTSTGTFELKYNMQKRKYVTETGSLMEPMQVQEAFPSMREERCEYALTRFRQGPSLTVDDIKVSRGITDAFISERFEGQSDTFLQTSGWTLKAPPVRGWHVVPGVRDGIIQNVWACIADDALYLVAPNSTEKIPCDGPELRAAISSQTLPYNLTFVHPPQRCTMAGKQFNTPEDTVYLIHENQHHTFPTRQMKEALRGDDALPFPLTPYHLLGLNQQLASSYPDLASLAGQHLNPAVIPYTENA